MDEEPELFTIIGVIARVFPVDGRVKPGEILGFVGRGNTSSGKFAGWDSVGKLGLWTVHTVLDRFEKEGIINGYWYDLISEHLLSIGARFGQNPKTCVG
jgi:hypothetical protein